MDKSIGIILKSELRVSETTIRQYWDFDGAEFVYKIKDLALELDLRDYKLTENVKASSYLLLHIGECECGNHISMPIYNRSDLKRILKRENLYFRCAECEERRNNEIKAQQKKIQEDLERIKREAMVAAIEEKRWQKLDDIELDVLYKIARATTKGEVFKGVFTDGVYGESAKNYWKVINKLERLSLISIERSDFGSRIERFYKLPELASSLFDFYNPIETTEDDCSDQIVSNELKISLKKNLKKLNVNHPEFSGEFEFGRDVFLKKGERYSYGGWLNDDGSIYIKISPLANSGIDAFEIMSRM